MANSQQHCCQSQSTTSTFALLHPLTSQHRVPFKAKEPPLPSLCRPSSLCGVISSLDFPLRKFPRQHACMFIITVYRTPLSFTCFLKPTCVVMPYWEKYQMIFFLFLLFSCSCSGRKILVLNVIAIQTANATTTSEIYIRNQNPDRKDQLLQNLLVQKKIQSSII